MLDQIREATYWLILLMWAVYLIYTVRRDDKKLRQQARESEFTLAVKELTLELSRQGLLSHRKNQYDCEEAIEISRYGKYNHGFKIRVPSLDITVEGEWFEDAVNKVNQAINEYHDEKRRQAREKCRSCGNACHGNWFGFKCSKGLIFHGRIPYDCTEYVKGHPEELAEEGNANERGESSSATERIGSSEQNNSAETD